MNTLREGLPPLPDRIKLLPVDARGYPTPWFVADVNGVRDFRLADAGKRVLAVKRRLCWVCGQPLGCYLAFVLGPMCTVTRTTSEPPLHRECAEFSVQACPFLLLPKAQYRSANLPESATQAPGEPIPRNPGCSAIWITVAYRTFRVDQSFLITVGEPTAVQWWAQGRRATLAEVQESIRTGLPALEAVAAQDRPGALERLRQMTVAAMRYLPAAA